MTKIAILLIATLSSSVAMAHSKQCDFSTDYDIELSPQRLLFTDHNNVKVAFYADRLLVNGQMLTLTFEQQQASQGFVRLTRQTVPKIVEIAIDGAELGVKAATIVVSNLFSHDLQAFDDLVQPIVDIADKIRSHASYDRINTQALDHTLNDELEQEIVKITKKAVSQYLGRVVGEVFAAAFSSEDTTDSFSKKMARLDKELNTYIDQQAEVIERKAEALCADLANLAEIDKSLETIEGFPKQGIIQ